MWNSRIVVEIMKKTIIFICAALVYQVVAVAQDLDPTVEVSREYEGKMIEVHKPAIKMSVPDTLYQFDLGFDYSVFDNPYKGAYEFNPYVLEMKPTTSGDSGNVFYLRAGAGYTLHPALDLLWSPATPGTLGVDVYAMHRSYIGEYRGLQQDAWNGYDLFSKAGADFACEWKKVALDFGASYYGIHDKDYRRSRGYNALDAYMTVRSKTTWPENFTYDVSASYRFAQDCSRTWVTGGLAGHEFNLDSHIRPAFGGVGRVVFDLGVEMDSYNGLLNSTAGCFRFVPRYVYKKGRLALDLGVRVSTVIASGEMNLTKGQYVYPDIRADLAVIPDAMKIYMRIGGGDRLNRYSSLVDANHHLDFSYGMSGASSLIDVSVERVSAVLGLEGRITSFFSYNIKGGYVNVKNGLLDAALADEYGMFMPAVGYSPYQKCFAAIDWNMTLSSIRFIGNVEYTHSWGIESDYMLAPSPLKGEAAIEYDWMNRIDAGVDCQFSLKRASGNGFTVPAYADLGVYAEYAMNRKLSFWLRGGNLLNMEIQRNLLYAEKGINFTAGICLTF